MWISRKKTDQVKKTPLFIESVGWHIKMQSHIWSPPTDFMELDDNYVVMVEIAGMHRQDFSIQIEDNYIIIKGIRQNFPMRKAFHQMEIRFGEFSTIVAIPGPIDIENVSAEYNDGFLVINIPKLNQNNTL